MGLALEAEGLKVSNYIKIPVWFWGLRVGQFEGDMLVADAVLLELKGLARKVCYVAILVFSANSAYLCGLCVK